jgi:hypothetical protein
MEIWKFQQSEIDSLIDRHTLQTFFRLIISYKFIIDGFNGFIV